VGFLTMVLLRLPEQSYPDIDRLYQNADIPALIRLLDHKDPRIQRHAAETLGTLQEKALPLLLEALRSPHLSIRLGVIEALGSIRDTRAVAFLIRTLDLDTSSEVRWAAAIALGEIGSPDAIPALLRMIRADNRYIRFGSAIALTRLGWQPEQDPDKIYQLIALQDWESVRSFGSAAVGPLMDMFRDRDPETRSAVITLLGEIGNPLAQGTCQSALRDRNPVVRWKAVLSSLNCGVASSELAPLLAGRERTGPDPAAAALLNFLFLGIGYNYIGKWWGFPLFMTYMTIIVLAQLKMGPFLPYFIAYPVTACFGVHTYYYARRLADG
jgi:hypothetical protein